MPPDAPRHDDGRRGADCFGGEILRRYRQHVLERYGFRTAPGGFTLHDDPFPQFAYAVEAPDDPLQDLFGYLMRIEGSIPAMGSHPTRQVA